MDEHKLQSKLSKRKGQGACEVFKKVCINYLHCTLYGLTVAAHKVFLYSIVAILEFIYSLYLANTFLYVVQSRQDQYSVCMNHMYDRQFQTCIVMYVNVTYCNISK